MPRLRLLSCAILSVLSSACPLASPAAGPETSCAHACAARAPHCSPEQCTRGCNFVLDRLVEHEGAPVLACVAAAARTCDDRTWAHCATRVGPHADGGPPPPPPPSDVEDIGEGD